MKATELYEEIRNFCKANADEVIVKKYSRYFKEGFDAYGLTKEKIEDKVKEILSDSKVNMKLVLSASRHLVKSGKLEETSFAILLLNEFSEQFTAETFKEIEKWFEIGIINWAHTDTVCWMITTEFFERNIIKLKAFSDWRTAKNKYQRRAVPVAMIKLLKKNSDYAGLFAFIEPLMMDSERCVQQGLGWFLREAWKIKRKQTESFLLKWKNKAPRLIYQYATEKMTKEEKQRFKREKK
ncbi:MAG: DNA alkylation repair protein [Phycisphaerales bacterium]|jgi:3-methyladenine DNA glycosylase AlkD